MPAGAPVECLRAISCQDAYCFLIVTVIVIVTVTVIIIIITIIFIIFNIFECRLRLTARASLAAELVLLAAMRFCAMNFAVESSGIRRKAIER